MNTKPPTTAEVLRGILDRIKSGEETPESVAEYRHVSGEISAWGAKFAEALRIRGNRNRRKSSPSNANVDLPDTAAQDSASKSNNPAVSG